MKVKKKHPRDRVVDETKTPLLQKYLRKSLDWKFYEGKEYIFYHCLSNSQQGAWGGTGLINIVK